jgi:ribosomal protein S27E
MVRCADYYEKWKKNPNWCNKCESSVHNINKFVGISDKIIEAGADPKLTYVKFSENVSRRLRGVPKETINGIMPEMVALIENPSVEKITKDHITELIYEFDKKRYFEEYPEEQSGSIGLSDITRIEDPFIEIKSTEKIKPGSRFIVKEYKCPDCGYTFPVEVADARAGQDFLDLLSAVKLRRSPVYTNAFELSNPRFNIKRAFELSNPLFVSPPKKSPRKTETRIIQVVCTDCGTPFNKEVPVRKKKDMKTGRKKFENTIG